MNHGEHQSHEVEEEEEEKDTTAEHIESLEENDTRLVETDVVGTSAQHDDATVNQSASVEDISVATANEKPRATTTQTNALEKKADCPRMEDAIILPASETTTLLEAGDQKEAKRKERHDKEKGQEGKAAGRNSTLISDGDDNNVATVAAVDNDDDAGEDDKKERSFFPPAGEGMVASTAPATLPGAVAVPGPSAPSSAALDAATSRTIDVFNHDSMLQKTRSSESIEWQQADEEADHSAQNAKAVSVNAAGSSNSVQGNKQGRDGDAPSQERPPNPPSSQRRQEQNEEGQTAPTEEAARRNDGMLANDNAIPTRATDSIGRETGAPSNLPDSERLDQESTLEASPSTTSLPVAQAYQELPMVMAEVVVPPAHATATATTPVMYQVDIDGDDAEQQRRPQFNSSTRDDDDDINSHEKVSKCGDTWRRKKRLILIELCVVIAVFFTGSYVGISRYRLFLDEEKERMQNQGNVSTMPIVQTPGAPSPTPGSQFDYPCYSSTLDLLTAQIEAPNDERMDPLIVCPNTMIRVGTFRNPLRNDFNWTNGDYPIIPIRPNVTIQCGLDGQWTNNCVLQDGLVHVFSQNSNHWHPKYGSVLPESNVDGFLLKGFTFIGTFQPSGPFGGISVAMGQPGKNMIFEDCAWLDIDATKRLLAVGRNEIMELQGLDVPSLSVELTLSNCAFESVSYEEEFMVSNHQTLHVQNTTFRNVKLSPLLSAGCRIHPNGCRNLMYCRGGGPNRCSISNVCVANFDVSGAGPIVISQDTEWSSSGVNTWIGPLEFGVPLEEGEEENINDSSKLPFCDLGVARLGYVLDDASSATYSCLATPTFESSTTTSACPSRIETL